MPRTIDQKQGLESYWETNPSSLESMANLRDEVIIWKPDGIQHG